MDNTTIIQQGRFTSTGANVLIPLRDGTDWMRVYNYTQIATNQTTVVGIEYYWQLGMNQNVVGTATAVRSGIVYYKSNAANAANLVQPLALGAGFTMIDSTIPIVGTQYAVSGVSDAAPPVVSTATTTGLVAGTTVVRLYNIIGGEQLGAMDFTIGTVVGSTSFTLKYMSAIVAAAGSATSYYAITYNSEYFYPAHRYITNIVDDGNGISSTVTLSVTHNYQVGAQIRFTVPAAFGAFTGLNQVQATVLAAVSGGTTNTIQVNVPTAQYGAFAFPVTAAAPFSPALVVPLGENTAVANSQVPPINSLLDATQNIGALSMLLAGGVSSPGGANGDIMYWVAGKSFSFLNM